MTLRQRFATSVLAGALICTGIVSATADSAAAAPLPKVSVAARFEGVATTAAAALAAVGTNGFAIRLDEAASIVAGRLGVDAVRLRQAWSAADQPHQIALLSALTQVGVPYHSNSSKAGVGFDCSGLTSFAWAQAGVSIAHQSGRQIRSAAARTLDTAEAGDLVYYPGHVMLWLGVDDLIVHAVGHGRWVELDNISGHQVKRAKFGNPIG